MTNESEPARTDARQTPERDKSSKNSPDNDHELTGLRMTGPMISLNEDQQAENE